jgi:hypothetical protein
MIEYCASAIPFKKTYRYAGYMKKACFMVAGGVSREGIVGERHVPRHCYR